MAPHLSDAELHKMVAMLKKKKTPQQMLTRLQRDRARKGMQGPTKTPIYDWCAGQTHTLDTEETRGRPAKFTKAMLKVLDGVRKDLIKKAGNEELVIWEDVQKVGKAKLRELGLLGPRQKMWSVDFIGRKMRQELDVRSRPAKRRIGRTEGEEKRRLRQAKDWKDYPARFWADDVSYIDSKNFVMAKTDAQRRKMRRQRVVSHLRTPAEGRKPGFIAPKKNRLLLGIPSVDITAAVRQDRIVFWHVNMKPWGGAGAEAMYKDLGNTLRKTCGNKRKYRVVEDGDPKGFQSTRGIAEKARQKIESWKLPVRSPEWMPLDFCLWHEIEERFYAKAPSHDETKKQFLKRLRSIAMRLPRQLVRKCLLSMRKRIHMTIEAKGRHIEID